MSAATLAKARKRIVRPVLDAVWAQWASIGPVASSPRLAQSVVDPEALVLISLALVDDERRLARLLAWGAKCTSKLLSVQRIKNLSKNFPPNIGDGLAGFAERALTDGGDGRWKSLVVPNRVGFAPTRGVDASAVSHYRERSSLMLRYRLALGVGIKSDVLTYLVGSVGAQRTVREITRATCYTVRAVRRAVEDLAASGFVHAVPSSPASYSIDFEPWAALMNLGTEGVLWRDWAKAFALFAHVLGWCADSENAKRIPYLLSSDARDLMSDHGEAFTLHHVRAIAPESVPGQAYLGVFLQDVQRLADRVESVV